MLLKTKMSKNNKKSFNSEIDSLLEGLELPSNESIKRETAAAIYSSNAKSHIEKRIANGWATKNALAHNTATVKEKRRQGLLRSQTKEVKEKRAKSCMKCVMTPDGPFESVKELCKFYSIKLNIGEQGARKRFYKWMRDAVSGYYYITKEEYEQLKGKQ
jgi:hypothetical protein